MMVQECKVQPRSQGSLSYPSLRENPGNEVGLILGDPGADSGGEGKSKRAEK